MHVKKILLVYIAICLFTLTQAQPVRWSADGASYYRTEKGAINQYTLPDNTAAPYVTQEQLVPKGTSKALEIKDFNILEKRGLVIIFTNTRKVWRYETKGDYWILDKSNGSLKKLGKGRPASSLMFAKISPDGKKAAYVSEYNLYVEDLATGAVKALTTGGNRKLINGTFDWAYEEEFFCRDGFRWSPDGKNIAYWQLDARSVKDHLMINNTDSIYPVAIPVEYPVAGELPSPFKIGVVDIATAKTTWMQIPYDKQWGSYLPRMDWTPGNKELIVQHLNRKQNYSRLMRCDARSGATRTIYEEKDAAWIDILPSWDQDYTDRGWDWIDNGNRFLWASEKDGWRHVYSISGDGRKETLITRGEFDVMDITGIDQAGGLLYFMASPDNATQKYLYRAKLDGSGTAERVSPSAQPGTHEYNISPNGRFAQHAFTNYRTPRTREWISLPTHNEISGRNPVDNALKRADENTGVEFFKVRTAEGVEMDAWMKKPKNFDPQKKYPVVFYVYTEPWGQEVRDVYGIADNYLYQGDMPADGYFYISMDNRGTPVPKGRAWRKIAYRKIGQVNIRDQAMGAKEIQKWPYIDSSRVAVWGWSGGGSATLNLMFQFPEIYKTGISIAAVGNQLTYDNIYQERYMGLPQENREDFLQGSPLTHARNLRGNLLYIHGTADDNVHYNNAEMLVNELIKHKKIFQFMPYPNRTHSISEGQGTLEHLSALYTDFLRRYCPPGAR
jgi:dipeptidyl-peptidase-4